MKTNNRQKAQAAVELAVFGSILIFSLGVMINSSFNKSNRQNAIYTATRKAMTLSAIGTRTMTQSNRNTASVLIIEDRLSAASAKYGAVDRTPFVFQGSGTHSSNLFMPLTFPGCPEGPDHKDDFCPPVFDLLQYTNHNDLPLFDFFVNGKQYSFTTSAFKYYSYLINPFGGNTGTCTCASFPPSNCSCEMERNCLGFGVATPVPCANQPNLCDPDVHLCAPGTCSPDSTEMSLVPNSIGYPCPVFYKQVQRHPLNERKNGGEWCTYNEPAPANKPPESGCPAFNLSVDERFDLDRDGFNPDGFPDVPPGSERENFSWQWVKVAGWQEKSEIIDSGIFRLANLIEAGLQAIGFDLKLGPLIGEGIDDENSKNVDIDVDGDLKPERIMGVVTVPPLGTVVGLRVMDFQDGDLDYTYTGPQEYRPGLLPDVNIYTYVSTLPGGGASSSGGTYLQIDEGKLFSTDGDNRQFIRTASKKDSIDIIERVFRLSNNTYRFCNVAGLPNINFDLSLFHFINPIEACGDCFGANISKTCMGPFRDKDGTTRWYIYMRTAVKDLHGRKWLTDVSGDPAIDFSR